MSIATFFSHLFGTDTTAAAAAVSNAPATTTTAVKAFAGSEAAKIVTALAATDIGAAVKADVTAMTTSGLSGADKFAAVLANTVPLLLKYATGGGIAAVESDVVGIAQSLVQQVYLDTASTSFGKVAGEFAKLLGI